MVFGGGVPRGALVGAGLKSDPEVDRRGHPAVAIVARGWFEGNARALSQAMVQAVPVWVRPMVIRRRRFNAPARWCSQRSFLAMPR